MPGVNFNFQILNYLLLNASHFNLSSGFICLLKKVFFSFFLFSYYIVKLFEICQELIDKRQKMLEEFRKYRADKEDEYNLYRERRIALRDGMYWCCSFLTSNYLHFVILISIRNLPKKKIK